MSMRQLRIEIEKASSKARCQPSYSLPLDTCASEILNKKKVEPQETKMFPSENSNYVETVDTKHTVFLLLSFSCVWHVLYMGAWPSMWACLWGAWQNLETFLNALPPFSLRKGLATKPIGVIAVPRGFLHLHHEGRNYIQIGLHTANPEFICGSWNFRY